MDLNVDDSGKLSRGGPDAWSSRWRASTRRSRTPSGVLDERQRLVVSYLDQKEGDTASFVELIDLLTGREIETPEQSAIDRLALSLYYVDLPVLAELGIVEYDKRSRTVHYRRNEPSAMGESALWEDESDRS